MKKKTAIAGFILVLLFSYQAFSQQSGNYKPAVVLVKTRTPASEGPVVISDWTPFETRLIDSLVDYNPSEINLSKYGGNKDVRFTATGFFRTEKIDNRWWVIDPEGYPNVHVGVNTIFRGSSDQNKTAFNQKFGSKDAWFSSTGNLLSSIYINGAGAWSDRDAIVKYNQTAAKPISYTINWNFMSAYGEQRGGISEGEDHTGYDGDVIFVFDPAFEAFCDEHAKQLLEYKNDPNLYGYFSDNEMPLDLSNLDNYLNLSNKIDHGYLAAKQWIDEQGITQSQITNQHRAKFLGVVADKYFSIVSGAIKKYDPNHLYLGSRFYGDGKFIPELFEAAGKYLDVVSVNYYHAWTPPQALMNKWGEWAKKPFIITEFYVKAEDSGLRNTSGAGWEVKTQKDRGRFYQNFALGLLENKNCVGWHWHKYQDNDVTVRSSGSISRTDTNKGLVDNTYTVYTTLADKMKQLNQNRYSLIQYFDQSATQSTWDVTPKYNWMYNFGSNTGNKGTTFTGTSDFSVSSATSPGFLPYPVSGNARVGAGSTGTPKFTLENNGLNDTLKFQASSSGTVGKVSFYDIQGAGSLSTLFGSIHFEQNTATKGDWTLATGYSTTANSVFNNTNGVNSSGTTSHPELFAVLRWQISGTNPGKITCTYRTKASADAEIAYTTFNETFFERGTTYKLEILCNNTETTQTYTRGETTYSVPSRTYQIWANGVRLPKEAGDYNFPANQLSAGMPVNSFLLQGANSQSGTVKDNSATVLLSGLSMELGLSTLPVSLLNFNARAESDKVFLNWQTASENNNSHFEILRFSPLDQSPVIIGEIVGKGTVNSNTKYSFIDKQPLLGTNFYQLRQVDYDGEFSLSKIVSIHTGFHSNKLIVFQSENKDCLVNIVSESTAMARFTLTDLNGRVLNEFDTRLNTGLNTLIISDRPLSPGIYVASLQINGTRLNSKFIVN